MSANPETLSRTPRVIVSPDRKLGSSGRTTSARQCGGAGAPSTRRGGQVSEAEKRGSRHYRRMKMTRSSPNEQDRWGPQCSKDQKREQGRAGTPRLETMLSGSQTVRYQNLPKLPLQHHTDDLLTLMHSVGCPQPSETRHTMGDGIICSSFSRSAAPLQGGTCTRRIQGLSWWSMEHPPLLLEGAGNQLSAGVFGRSLSNLPL